MGVIFWTDFLNNWQEPATAKIGFSGGVIDVAGEVWVADQSGQLITDISAYCSAGQVQWNNQSPVRGQFSLTVEQAGLAYAFTSCLAPFMNYYFADGTTWRIPLGLFIPDIPSELVSPEDTEVSFTAYDMSWRLNQSEFANSYTVAQGANYVNEVRKLLVKYGIQLYSILDNPATTPAAITFQPGKNVLEAVNQLLYAIAYRDIYSIRTGYLVGRPSLDPTQLTSYRDITINDMWEHPKISTPSNLIYNIVRVTKNNPNQAPLYSIARNDDPTSPTSTVKMQMDRVNQVDIPYGYNQAKLDTYAKHLLIGGGSSYRVLDLTLEPDIDFDGNLALKVTYSNADEDLSGLYQINQWRMGLDETGAALTMSVGRVIDYAQGHIEP